jgi:hypothetical protein
MNPKITEFLANNLIDLSNPIWMERARTILKKYMRSGMSTRDFVVTEANILIDIEAAVDIEDVEDISVQVCLNRLCVYKEGK